MSTFLEGNLCKPSFATVTGCVHAFRWGMSLPTPTPEHREAPGTKGERLKNATVTGWGVDPRICVSTKKQPTELAVKTGFLIHRLLDVFQVEANKIP